MKELNEQERDVITLTKGIGIFLVVLAHALPTDCLAFNVIYVFHMPLFFMMSGYCFKEKYLSNAKQFVMRKIKGIYVPFVVFSLIFLALHNVFCSLKLYDPATVYDWKTFLWDIGRIVTRMSNSERFLCTFWFLKELFWGNLFFYGMLRLWRGKVIQSAISLLVLSEIAIVVNLRIPYFTITFVSFFAAFFIAVGYWWRTAEWRLDRWWLWEGALAIFVGNMYIPYSSFIVNVTPTTLPIYVLPAIIGTIMTFELCRWILPYLRGWSKSFLLFMGNESLFIMALHFVAFKIVLLGEIKIYHLPLEKLYDFPIIYNEVHAWSMLLCTLLGVILPLGIAWIWKKGRGLSIAKAK